MHQDMKSNSSKIFDFVKHELEIDKIIRAEFNDSQMSNAKWKKLLMHLAVKCPNAHAIWKFVGSENDGVALTGLPAIDELEKSYINQRFWFGPRYYKEIQWLSFQKVIKRSGFEHVPSQNTVQDTGFILNELNNLGKWPIEESADGFTIYGHK